MNEILERNADIKMPDNIDELKTGVLMDCVETKKVNDMIRVCTGARAGCVGSACLVLFAGLALPVLFRNGGAMVAWWSMGLEAGAFGLLRVSTWISKHVL